MWTEYKGARHPATMKTQEEKKSEVKRNGKQQETEKAIITHISGHMRGTQKKKRRRKRYAVVNAEAKPQ